MKDHLTSDRKRKGHFWITWESEIPDIFYCISTNCCYLILHSTIGVYEPIGSNAVNTAK